MLESYYTSDDQIPNIKSTYLSRDIRYQQKQQWFICGFRGFACLFLK